MDLEACICQSFPPKRGVPPTWVWSHTCIPYFTVQHVHRVWACLTKYRPACGESTKVSPPILIFNRSFLPRKFPAIYCSYTILIDLEVDYTTCLSIMRCPSYIELATIIISLLLTIIRERTYLITIFSTAVNGGLSWEARPIRNCMKKI